MAGTPGDMWFTGRLEPELPAHKMLDALAALGADSPSLLGESERSALDTRGFTGIGPVLTPAQCERMKQRLAAQVELEGPRAGTELLEKQIDNLVKQGADRKQVLSQEDGVNTLCDLPNKASLNHDGLFDTCFTHPKYALQLPRGGCPAAAARYVPS
jgi:hypothetical protein